MLDNKHIVLEALINAYKSEEEILDIMKIVNSESLCMTEIQFSETMYMLQEEGIISGVDFENNNSKEITLWDNVRINTEKIKTYLYR